MKTENLDIFETFKALGNGETVVDGEECVFKLCNDRLVMKIFDYPGWEDKDSEYIILPTKIYKEPLTFKKLDKLDKYQEWVLVNQYNEKRKFIGFSRNGELITDSFNKGGSMSWKEHQIKNWTIVPYIKEGK